MKYLPNNWNAIRAFYREAQHDIIAAGRNEWGIDTYLWDGLGMIHFTPIEYWLWHDIRAVDAVLYPQYPVGRFFVDFGNPVAKVAIECDGAAFHNAQKDAQRDSEIGLLGWTVYRFPGWQCKTDSDEETGKSGEAYERMLQIAEVHGIDRKSRAICRDDWERLDFNAEAVFESVCREAEIAGAARRAGAR